jgi:NADPH2:quinone reductase
MMRVARVEKPGGPEAIAIVDLPTPAPQSGEALVRVEAAGVNFIDVYHRNGLYQVELPARLGLEGAGVVESIGAGVNGVRAGDRVAWSGVAGSYATHVVAPVARLVPIPDRVTSRDAAAAMLQGMTAHYLTRSTYRLARGETCLVQAVAGGLGLLVCQLAKLAAARVIGTTSSEEKAKLAREHGADDVILYTQQDFFEEVMRLTSKRGVDVVYDSVGKSTFDKSLMCLRPRGMLVACGNASGAVPPFDPLVLSARGSLYLTRPKLADYTATREELLERAHDVLDLVAKKELRLRIHAELPLDRAADAHRLLESRATIGKLLLLP